MSERLPLALGGLVLALFLALGLHFAAAQSLWTDETTQLSGLGLGFWPQLDWLMGGANPIPGVPPDRMPPLSYWLGSLWAGAFGLTEMSLRLMGLGAALAGAPALWLAAARLAPGARLAPVLLLALVYLAPGLVVQAVEIRAYPLFFAFASWALWALLRALEEPAPGRLAALAGFCLLAIHCHFFGLVMAGLFWLTLLIARRRGSVFLGGLATLVLSGGLYPFVRAALGMTGEAAPVALATALRDTVRLGFRLLFHGSQLPDLPLVILAALAGAGMLALALWRGGARWLVLPLGLAFVLLPLLKLRIAGFDVLAPHYNIWAVPTLALALVPALQVRAGQALAGVLVLAALAGDARLVRQPEPYTHGPGDWVAEAVTDPARTVVVHDGAGDWGATYFALYYRTGGQLAQVLRSPGAPDRRLLPGQPPQPLGPDFVTSFPRALFLRSATRTTAELQADPVTCGLTPMLEAPPARFRCALVSASLQEVRQGP